MNIIRCPIAFIPIPRPKPDGERFEATVFGEDFVHSVDGLSTSRLALSSRELPHH